MRVQGVIRIGAHLMASTACSHLRLNIFGLSLRFEYYVIVPYWGFPLPAFFSLCLLYVLLGLLIAGKTK